MRHDIQTDGITVWVHRGGETIGRFGVFGIDIHRPIADQIQGRGQCLACTHERTTKQDWIGFARLMLLYYEIEVGAEFLPTRFRAT
jgi:hypothetical protein